MSETNGTCPKWCIRCGKECTNYRTIIDDTGHNFRHCNECDGLVVNARKVQFDWDDISALQQSLRERDEQLEAVRKERDELICAVWCLDKPDDASHEETLAEISRLSDCQVKAVELFVQRDAATARAEHLAAGVAKLEEEYRNMQAGWVCIDVANNLAALLAQPGEEKKQCL